MTSPYLGELALWPVGNEIIRGEAKCTFSKRAHANGSMSSEKPLPVMTKYAKRQGVPFIRC